jgi:hypothetical protein
MIINPKNLRLMTVLVILGMNGCMAVVGTVALGTAAVVGTVGLAGYTVYKGGEAVVTTTGNVVSKSHKSVVMSRGTLKAECEYSVSALYDAGVLVLKSSGFKNLTGRKDILAGALRALTAFDEEVLVTFEAKAQGVTAVLVRIGEGNLKQSELIYDYILRTVENSTSGAPS